MSQLGQARLTAMEMFRNPPHPTRTINDCRGCEDSPASETPASLGPRFPSLVRAARALQDKPCLPLSPRSPGRGGPRPPGSLQVLCSDKH